MSNQKINNPPVLPYQTFKDSPFGGFEIDEKSSGITICDYFAARAMQALITKYDVNPYGPNPIQEHFIKIAYEYGQAAVRERTKRGIE